MTDQVAPNLQRDDILRVLSRADEAARERGDELAESRAGWIADFEFLFSDECPVTYLPVLAVMLVARSIRESDTLDVLDIQQGSSSRGYSASSIAKHLITFVVQQRIDLRTTSSQVMNSQPFTYKKRVTSDMAGDRVRAAYARFYSMAERVEGLTSEAAAELLALLFHLRRGAGQSKTDVLVISGNRETLEAIVDVAAQFVNENSESGKVGQAFAAALFDLLFPNAQVRMGNNNDPSAVIPGDVQVGNDGDFWLWAEVKQKSVVTSEVQAFVDRVKAIGGDRAWYFALANSPYPHNLDVAQLQKRAIRDGIELTVYSAPEQALSDLLAKSAGSAGMLAESLANRMVIRLHEAQVTSALEEAWAHRMGEHT
ncbi:MAG: restriction endonuclease, SacI family [Legionella sp.]|nr:restriction endonuclease, SacI family [Legionella sp.]